MRLLALVDAPDHVCCRYRVLAFGPALAAAGIELTVEPLAQGPVDRLAQFARAGRYDAVLLQRKLLPSWQFYPLRRCAKRLLFDFDDAVLFRDSYDERGPHDPSRLSRFSRTVRLADGVLAGNDFLAECAVRSGGRPERIRVVPTCVDTALYPESPPRPGRGLTLAWIGSSSTLQGLERSRDLWDRAGREVPGLRLRIVADRPADLGALPVDFVPWSEATEAVELSRADAGLGWVPDDLWSRGKCGLKLLQYGAAGRPSVANPVGVHRRIVEPGVTGLLPSSDDAWIAALRRLADDPALRARMGRAARVLVERRYGLDTWGPALVAIVTGHAPAPAPRLADPPVARPAARTSPTTPRSGRVQP